MPVRACEPDLEDKRILGRRLEPASCLSWKLVFLKATESLVSFDSRILA